ncbi:MAG: VTT domain-containing protein [Verrucomicrobia bacterium]|nr:VTT domain-containing protein [Verrucomicrobiota bacterium]MCH8526780.1 DedA family protein [Kiritimatiellia bacterium]
MSTPGQRNFWIRNRIRLLWAYLAVLLCSHLTVRLSEPPAFFQPATGFSTGSEAETLILFDPLDPSASHVLELLNAPGSEFQVTIPELPGLNTLVPSPGGFEELADRLADAHRREARPPGLILANGHAGAVALHLAANHPEQVAGIILLDATGVQELSLLGEYHLNYALYAVSENALRLFHTFAPHFGASPRWRLRQAQLHLLRHSDRRVLRPRFSDIEHPVLILRNPGETLRTVAAREHERLLPQSRTATLYADQSLHEVVDRYRAEYQRGDLPVRHQADPVRLEAAANRDLTPERPPPSAAVLIALLLAIAFATLITEDLTCVLVGLMIANGNLTWAQGIGACLAGILFWDYLIYIAGRRMGRPVLQRIPFRWLIDPLTLRETEEWFDRRAAEAIFITRLIPGTRYPAYFAAGILGVPVKTFTPLFLLAVLTWTPAIVWISVRLAEQALEWMTRYHHTAPALVVAGLAGYWLFSHILLPACSWRGRRKLYGKWKRWTAPEYWPAILLYTPVTLFLLLRALRRENRLLDFTACNPCMPASGLVGESKSAILDAMEERAALAPYILLHPDEPLENRQQQALDFLSQHPPGFPVVFKPDSGERGAGVRHLADRAALVDALETQREPHLLQLAQSGEEFGVFYIRHPLEDRGRIFAITRKTFPVVDGDGKRNLEDLILADKRAVCQFRTHFEHLRDRLYTVPAAGEAVPLSKIGNHARGTLFEDGMHLLTPELEARIDAVSRSLPGFYFGRYDLFAPDTAAFQAGKGLSIIELNGVTSEATNLYAPGTSIFAILRILLRQWSHACAIGKTNREQGAPILTFKAFLHRFDQSCKRDNIRRLKLFSSGKPPTP